MHAPTTGRGPLASFDHVRNLKSKRQSSFFRPSLSLPPNTSSADEFTQAHALLARGEGRAAEVVRSCDQVLEGPKERDQMSSHKPPAELEAPPKKTANAETRAKGAAEQDAPQWSNLPPGTVRDTLSLEGNKLVQN